MLISCAFLNESLLFINIFFSPLIEKEGPLKIEVSGIDCMNNNHKSVDVLYAKAKIINENENTSLQKIINGLSDHFYERGKTKPFLVLSQ